jgi:ABC-2 type transport system ATP-binding protein
LSKVAKSYGSVQAVRGIDLTVAPGTTVALLGPNGAGKTTTIDMILGLSRPDSGAVSVFGVSPAEAVKSDWISGTLQDGSRPDQLRVRELVTLMASYYPQVTGARRGLDRCRSLDAVLDPSRRSRLSA